MLNFGECQSLNADNLPYTVNLSPIQTPPPANDGYFLLLDLKSNYLKFWVVPPRNTSAVQPYGYNLVANTSYFHFI